MTSQTANAPEVESSESTEHTTLSPEGTDTGRWKRLGIAALGGLLLVRGLRRRSVRGLLQAGAGGWLLYRTFGQGGGDRPRTTPQAGEGEHRSETGAPAGAVDVRRTITIEGAAEELYEQWRDPDAHERIWSHFAEVRRTDDDRQHWSVGGPMDVSLEWEAEVVEDDPGEFLRWESLPGASVPNEGSVRFEERATGDETEVTLRLRFEPPGGRVGAAAASRLEMIPEAAVGTALSRFKSLVETGEIPTLEGNPSARGRGDWL